MAHLDLIPNTQIIIAQIGVFFLARLAVKNLFVSPYLKLKAAQDEQTKDKLQKAEEDLKKTQRLKEELLQKIKLYKQQLDEKLAIQRQICITKNHDLIEASRQKSKEYIDIKQKEIAGLLKIQTEKLEATSTQLMNEVLESLSLEPNKKRG